MWGMPGDYGKLGPRSPRGQFAPAPVVVRWPLDVASPRARARVGSTSMRTHTAVLAMARRGGCWRARPLMGDLLCGGRGRPQNVGERLAACVRISVRGGKPLHRGSAVRSVRVIGRDMHVRAMVCRVGSGVWRARPWCGSLMWKPSWKPCCGPKNKCWRCLRVCASQVGTPLHRDSAVRAWCRTQCVRGFCDGVGVLGVCVWGSWP